MIIDHVKNIEELNSVLRVWEIIFPNSINYSEDKSWKEFWIERLSLQPELLLYAKDDNEICGFVLSSQNNVDVSIHSVAVIKEYRNQGIAKALLIETEERVKKLGCRRITLGAVESAEGLYAKLGYYGSLLIQSSTHGIDELKSFNEQNKNYPVIWTNIYSGTINQICLCVPIADRGLQIKYEQSFDNCWTQMIFMKHI